MLEAQGVLRRPQVGTGPESGNIIAGMPSTGLTRLLRVHVALSNFPLEDVVEARITMERGSARLAAAHATPEHLARMRELLDRMDDPSLPREEFNDLDTEFHVVMAEAAGNRLITDLTTALRNALGHDLLRAFGKLDDWDTTAAVLRRDHHAVYEAVVDGDGEKAAARVENHIRDFYRKMSDKMG